MRGGFRPHRTLHLLPLQRTIQITHVLPTLSRLSLLLTSLFHQPLKILKTDYHYSNIILCAFVQWILHHLLNNQTAKLVNTLVFISLLRSLPYDLNDLLIWHLIKYAIAWVNNLLLARRIKSVSDVILKDLISGVAITTLEFPPNSDSLASISPIDLVIANLPGRTLQGPRR